LAGLSHTENPFRHTEISNPNGFMQEGPAIRTPEYGPAFWVEKPRYDYSIRNRIAKSAVKTHTISNSN
tara:strand:- start:413 stop:616 length:204 start_codon:yes stop_codon:yes gene_type:complete